MANKLWDKGFKEDERIDAFTVGNDRELDHELAPYDIMGTMAHITMLESVGLLSKEDLDKLLPVLKELYSSACKTWGWRKESPHGTFPQRPGAGGLETLRQSGD